MLPKASEHPIGPWRITHTVLRIELANDSVRVENDMHVERVEGEPFGPLVLDGRALEILEVALDGATLGADQYELSDRTMSIELADSPHVVRTVTAAIPGGANDSGFTRRPGLLSTNCEPQGFRRITYFLDRPAVRATYDVTLVADPIAFPVMLANGHHVGEGTLPDGRHWARFDDPITKPSYLFAVVAGDLSIESRPYVTGTGRTIRLAVAAPPEQIDGVEYALHSMADAMSYDEAHGGIEHDLDVLTFVSIPGYPDATEYHGLMFFESGVLVVDTRGYVDDDLLLISANVAHEYGHHTRGNRITVRTWGQLALKEGLTVLTAQNDYRRHMFGPVARVLDVLDLRRVQFPEEITIGAPVVRGEVSDPSALYTRTTYLKGAEVFGMLRTLVGPERWTEAFGQFVRAYDLDAVGVAEFVQTVRQVAPQHAAAIDGISRWFTLAGRPAIDIEVGPTGLQVRRTDALTDEPPVSMPVVLGFRDLAGAPLAVQLDDGPIAAEHTVVLAERQRSLRVQSAVPFVLSPLRRYSSPVDLRCELPSDQLSTLLVHDDDPFARWWASEELMIRVIDAHRGGDDARADAAMSALSGALAAVVPAEPDPVLLAQLLSVPDEFMLGDREERIDVDGVARGLEFLRGRLGREVRQPLLDALERFSRDQATGTSPADIGARMLVEPVLAPLLATGDSDGVQLAMQELRSPNATRAMRAFGQLAHLDSVALDDLVALTYERWQHAPKLIDRWLRAQSGSRRSDTVERVARLASGPLYDRADRARVMGVWFPFATRNRAVFHHPSGEGYRVFVDELGELMPVNAGLAVRLVGDLLQFRRFDDHRAALMRAELTRMADMQGMPDFAVGILRNLLT